MVVHVYTSLLSIACSDQCNIPVINQYFFLLVGTALKCQECTSLSSEHLEVRCNATTVECPTGHCLSVSLTTDKDQEIVSKGCLKSSYCRKNDIDKACEFLKKRFNFIKSCDGSCCSTDFCNTAKEIMAAKAFICLMAIVGYFLA